MNCPSCFKNSFREIFKPRLDWKFENQPFSYLECQNCGLIVSNPIPTDAQVKNIYGKLFDYSAYKKVEFLKKLQASHRFFKHKKYFSKGLKSLDVGAGHGYFVHVLKEAHLDSWGFDVSDNASLERNQKDKLQYYPKLSDVKETNFDVITMWHTLEHINDPVSIIGMVKDKLKPGGKLLIGVPNSESVGMKFCKDRWVWTQPPFIHVFHFSAKNLTMMLENNGSNVTEVKTTDTWDAQFIDYFAPIRKFKFTIMKILPKKFAFCFDHGLRLVFTPLSYFLSIFYPTKGSELFVVAVKK